MKKVWKHLPYYVKMLVNYDWSGTVKYDLQNKKVFEGVELCTVDPYAKLLGNIVYGNESDVMTRLFVLCAGVTKTGYNKADGSQINRLFYLLE